LEIKSGTDNYNRRGRQISKRLVVLFVLAFLICITFSVYADNGFIFRIKIDNETFDVSFKTEAEIRESSCLHLTNKFWVYFLFLPGIIVFVVLFFNRHKVSVVFIIFSVFLLLGVSDPFPTYHITNGFLKLDNGNYEDALNDFKLAEKDLPCNPALKYNIALMFYLTENRSNSLCYLRKSIILDPQDAVPRNVLGIIERKLGLKNQVPPGIKLHPDIPFIFLIVFTNLTCIILGLVYRYKKGGLFIFFVFFVFLSSCSLAMYVFSLSEIDEKVGVVAHDEGILKKIPMDIANSWMSFTQGTSLKINGFANGYWLVESEHGFEGFIYETDLLIVNE